MSFFKKLTAGFKSPESPPPASDSSSPAPHSAPAPSAISDSPQQAVARPFEFWTSNLNEQSVAEAKSKFLDLNAKDPYGEPALIRAARHGDAAVTKALLEAGAEINISDSSGETAVSWAAQMGKTEVLAILIASPEVHLEKSDKGGRTALYDACCCQFSNVECVELLLDRGAQPTVEMLHAAFDEARLACLLSRGCVPDDIPVFLHHCIRSKGFVRPDLDSKRFAPLTRQSQGPSQAAPHDDPINSAKQKAMSHAPHARKRKDYHFNLEDWIKRAGNADCPDANGMTLLMNACGKANINAVEVLITHGADVAALDSNGRHAIHYVAQRLHPSTIKAMKIAEIILEKTHDQAINQRDKRGTTPLMQACQKGHIDAMNMLMDRAKNVGVLDEVLEATDNRGYNVLHHASEHLLSTAIRHLLSSQPHLTKILNSRTTPLGKADRKDATPLHLAIMASVKGAGGLETCITLADFGCSLRVRNLDGYTGLELLEKMKKTNNELGQWALLQDRAEQGGTVNVKHQTKLATWLLETCTVRNICGSASAKRWLEAAAQEGDKQAADKLAQLTL